MKTTLLSLSIIATLFLSFSHLPSKNESYTSVFTCASPTIQLYEYGGLISSGTVCEGVQYECRIYGSSGAVCFDEITNGTKISNYTCLDISAAPNNYRSFIVQVGTGSTMTITGHAYCGSGGTSTSTSASWDITTGLCE